MSAGLLRLLRCDKSLGGFNWNLFQSSLQMKWEGTCLILVLTCGKWFCLEVDIEAEAQRIGF